MRSNNQCVDSTHGVVDKPMLRLVRADVVNEVEHIGVFRHAPVVNGDLRRRLVAPLRQSASFQLLDQYGVCVIKQGRKRTL